MSNDGNEEFEFLKFLEPCGDVDGVIPRYIRNEIGDVVECLLSPNSGGQVTFYSPYVNCSIGKMEQYIRVMVKLLPSEYTDFEISITEEDESFKYRATITVA